MHIISFKRICSITLTFDFIATINFWAFHSFWTYHHRLANNLLRWVWIILGLFYVIGPTLTYLRPKCAFFLLLPSYLSQWGHCLPQVWGRAIGLKHTHKWAIQTPYKSMHKNSLRNQKEHSSIPFAWKSVKDTKSSKETKVSTLYLNMRRMVEKLHHYVNVWVLWKKACT